MVRLDASRGFSVAVAESRAGEVMEWEAKEASGVFCVYSTLLLGVAVAAEERTVTLLSALLAVERGVDKIATFSVGKREAVVVTRLDDSATFPVASREGV